MNDLATSPRPLLPLQRRRRVPAMSEDGGAPTTALTCSGLAARPGSSKAAGASGRASAISTKGLVSCICRLTLPIGLANSVLAYSNGAPSQVQHSPSTHEEAKRKARQQKC